MTTAVMMISRLFFEYSPFSELKGKTKMEMSMTLPTPEAAEETRKFIKMAGGNTTWDRLAEFMEKDCLAKRNLLSIAVSMHRLTCCFELWDRSKTLLSMVASDRIQYAIYQGRYSSRRQQFLLHDW